jgi:hypothetical protein
MVMNLIRAPISLPKRRAKSTQNPRRPPSSGWIKEKGGSELGTPTRNVFVAARGEERRKIKPRDRRIAAIFGRCGLVLTVKTFLEVLGIIS